jgi:hypothetical protein
MFDTVRYGPVLTEDAVCTEDAFDEVVSDARALFDGHRDMIFGCVMEMAGDRCMLEARR